MAALVLKRTALFVVIILAWAVLAAAVANSTPRDIVRFEGFAPGTIVVKTNERRLYFVIDNYRALRFPVGVGRRGKQWNGVARVEGKYVRPAWQAPPELGGGPVIPGGSPNNPMGAAALTLRGGEYAIHGTNRPQSIGGFVSSGCIRMHNSDILDLYRRAPIGTEVHVLR